MSKDRLSKLLNDYKIPIEDIVNPMRMKWSKDNINHVKQKSEIPEYIKTATLNELFAACPFSYGGAIQTMPKTNGEL